MVPQTNKIQAIPEMTTTPQYGTLTIIASQTQHQMNTMDQTVEPHMPHHVKSQAVENIMVMTTLTSPISQIYQLK